MIHPNNVPLGDTFDEPDDHSGEWHAIGVVVTNPEPIGTLWVVTNGLEEQWTLVDRDPIRFGFS